MKRTQHSAGRYVSCLLALTVGAALSPITAVRAADAPRKEAGFGGKATGSFLTRDQLKSCLSLKARIAKSDDDLLKEQAAIAVMKDDIGKRGDANKALLETLDRSSETAVAAYNEQAQAHDKLIDDYQARADAFNARVGSGQADHDAYAKSCNNHRYFEDEEAAILKGK